MGLPNSERFIAEYVSKNFLIGYQQDRGCLMHFANLARTLLKVEESVRDNYVFACNFATNIYRYTKSLTDSATNFS